MEPQIHPCICAWSDLLGFARPLVETSWRPSPAIWATIAARLQRAYDVHLRGGFSPGDFMLMLNDGIVKAKTWKDGNFAAMLSLWMRDVVVAHIQVNWAEQAAGLPGTRTVVAAGERVEYGISEVRFDDFVADYTRSRPGISKAAEAFGNPLMIANPAPLQMNTAFSKAYFLESGGSRINLSGSAFYVDASVIELLRSVAAADSSVEWREQPSVEGALYVMAYKNGSAACPWNMGLLVDAVGVAVDTPTLNTMVYRLRKFYPHDEDPSVFWFDVDERVPPKPPTP